MPIHCRANTFNLTCFEIVNSFVSQNRTGVVQVSVYNRRCSQVESGWIFMIKMPQVIIFFGFDMIRLENLGNNGHFFCLLKFYALNNLDIHNSILIASSPCRCILCSTPWTTRP